jgi:hypothetical protein
MIYRIKSTFIIFFTLLWALSAVASVSDFSQVDCRFYAATAADLDGDGRYEIIAVGQIRRPQHKDHSAFIVLLSTRDKGFVRHTDFSFNVSVEGKKVPSRIRSVQVIKSEAVGEWDLFLTGRGGDDETGVGFLYHAGIKNNKIFKRGEKIFKHENTNANHGYALAVADLDSDGVGEIVYGGFYEKNGKDWADVRVLKTKDGALHDHSRPFEKLDIPLRVNAIVAGDVDNDGGEDIVIAGRTRNSAGREFSAVAWWSKGKLFHHVFAEDHQSRLRTIEIIDLDGNQKNEFLTGGRIEIGDLWLADLRVWRLDKVRMKLIDRFSWSLGNKIRLRSISNVKESLNRVKIGGRAEWLAPDGNLKWKGFVWEFSLDKGELKPVFSPRYFDYGPDTRVRHLYLTETGNLIASGFTKGTKDTGFISIIDTNKKHK